MILMYNIATITPVKIFRYDNGTLSRSIERVSLHIQSILSQKGSFKVTPIISDMSNDKTISGLIEEIANHYNVRYIHTNSNLLWNKALCLNIGIKSTPEECTHIATLDMDILFREDVFEKCLEQTDKVVICRTFQYDSEIIEPDFSIETFNSLLEHGEHLCLSGNGGIQFFKRVWLMKMHGYDERFNLWGGPDNEMVLRMKKAKIKSHWLSVSTKEIYLLHLKHERWQIPGVDLEYLKQYREENNLRFLTSLEVVANPHSWGEEKHVTGPRWIHNTIKIC